MSSLFEPPGERKLPSILEIMDAFASTKFILFGDSGEQDLELYTRIAIERPEQVAGIFIRDVTSNRANGLRRLPVVNSKVGAAKTTAKLSAELQQVREAAEITQAIADMEESTISGRPTRETSGNDPSAGQSLPGVPDELQDLTSAQHKILRKASEWEARIILCQRSLPPGMIMRFFEHANEVEELVVNLIRETSAE
jgi:hypothetical protein